MIRHPKAFQAFCLVNTYTNQTLLLQFISFLSIRLIIFWLSSFLPSCQQLKLFLSQGPCRFFHFLTTLSRHAFPRSYHSDPSTKGASQKSLLGLSWTKAANCSHVQPIQYMARRYFIHSIYRYLKLFQIFADKFNICFLPLGCQIFEGNVLSHLLLRSETKSVCRTSIIKVYDYYLLKRLVRMRKLSTQFIHSRFLGCCSCL